MDRRHDGREIRELFRELDVGGLAGALVELGLDRLGALDEAGKFLFWNGAHGIWVLGVRNGSAFPATWRQPGRSASKTFANAVQPACQPCGYEDRQPRSSAGHRG